MGYEIMVRSWYVSDFCYDNTSEWLKKSSEGTYPLKWEQKKIPVING